MHLQSHTNPLPKRKEEVVSFIAAAYTTLVEEVLGSEHSTFVESEKQRMYFKPPAQESFLVVHFARSAC